MQVREIKVRWEGKLGLANYSSVMCGIELDAEVSEGEDVARGLADLLQIAREAGKAQLRKRLENGDGADPAEQVAAETKRDPAFPRRAVPGEKGYSGDA